MSKNFAEFPTPDGSGKIVRCYTCRENRNGYSTPDGSFRGP